MWSVQLPQGAQVLMGELEEIKRYRHVRSSRKRGRWRREATVPEANGRGRATGRDGEATNCVAEAIGDRDRCSKGLGLRVPH